MPNRSAFGDLEQLVRHVGEELALFRRRALTAEARVKELEASLETAQGEPTAHEPVSTKGLSAENVELRARLATALERTTQLGERIRFLRQQTERGADR